MPTYRSLSPTSPDRLDGGWQMADGEMADGRWAMALDLPQFGTSIRNSSVGNYLTELVYSYQTVSAISNSLLVE